MGKKKSNESTVTTKSKPKLSVSAMLASMDQKASSSRARAAPKEASSYTDGIDLPPLFEEDADDSDEEHRERRKAKSEQRHLNVSKTKKDQKKLVTKERKAKETAELAKMEALRDDQDAFTFHIGSKTSVLEGENKADANVQDITTEPFSVSVRGSSELLRDTCLRISHGKRYGLVGPNGMGKSTLLKLLAWRKIPVPKKIDLLLVEQEVVGDEKSALDAVVSANEKLFKLSEEAEALQIADDDDDSEGKLAKVHDEQHELSSDAAKAQAAKILAGLGFTEKMQERRTSKFSGGWRMRISLAKALFMEPTLLLLDEPTNHLDLRAVLWLVEYLSCRWNKTLVVVSHDRDFLNSVCTDIIHLHDKKLHFYGGNFDSFKVAYKQRRNEVNEAKKSGNRVQQEKVKKKAKSKGKGKEREAPRKWKDYSVEFHFPEPTELTPPLLQLSDVSFSYPERPEDDFRLSNVDVCIDMGTRVAIVGANGAGKLTLLNLVAGDLEPTEGQVRRSQKLRIGRYCQHFVDSLTMHETPVHYLLKLHPDQKGFSKQEAVRAELGNFGLPKNNHLTPIAKLSGGQKARVVFTSMSLLKPHIMILDEPTNHLDMESIDALGDALDAFTGGIVLVSHDSRLISRVCKDEEKSQIWVVKEGRVTSFDGSFEEYKEDLLKQIRAEVDK